MKPTLPADGLSRPRFSVVIPTYQRRELVVAAVEALGRQEFADTFEVIVVVDGSKDGTAESLNALKTPMALHVIEQKNSGAAVARNQGAEQATGELLLFLDDDMESDPHLLAEHLASHRAGADVVLGDIPIHPDSPRGLLSERVRMWSEKRANRLAVPGAELTSADMLTGQISLRRDLFNRIAGFDTRFTREGSFGNEDTDLGYRLFKGGYKIVYNSKAITLQTYVIRAGQYLRQYFDAGHADVEYVRKHPDQIETIFPRKKLERKIVRRWFRPICRWPFVSQLIGKAASRLAVWLVEEGFQDWRTARFFSEVKNFEYWRGVARAGGIPHSRMLRVLAYHAIEDLSDNPKLKPYGIPGEEFRQQLTILRQAGYKFVSGEEALNFLDGRAYLPRHAVLLTFDDCYVSVLENALPILQEAQIPAVSFAVSGQLGGFNRWDERLGKRLPLLDAEGLKTLERHRVEIGAHSRTHPQLPRIKIDDLPNEIDRSVEELNQAGLQRPRLFAYPYGEHNEGVRAAVASAGLTAAFTVEPGFVRRGENRFALPRIEILRGDLGRKLRWKVAVGGPLRSKGHGSEPFLFRLRRRFFSFATEKPPAI